MSDPDNRPFYEQVDSIRNLLKAGGSRKLAMQELMRLSLAMRRDRSPGPQEMASGAESPIKCLESWHQGFLASSRAQVEIDAEQPMVGSAREALDANAIEKHRRERARAFAQWELATKPYEGWGR